MSFKSIINQISTGQFVSQYELLPHLSNESVHKRAHINYQLAEAYYKSGNFAQAQVFIERAWFFSGFSPDYFELYKDICHKTNDIYSIRDAY
ncbi:MAG: tetratricopeptide repeat protein, partial [Geobacteraceae bacterium]|nr:tetratricopeptide repeat protein [Geobacteraceae bacterium]